MTRNELFRRYLHARRALTINRDSVCVRMLMRLEGVGGTAAITFRNNCKSVGSDLYFLESLLRSR